MTARGAHRLAFAVASLALAGTVATWSLVVSNLSVLTSVSQVSIIAGTLPVGFALAGGLLASRLPANAVGWLLLATAVLVAGSGVAAQLAIHGALVQAGAAPWVEWVAWVANWIGAPAFPGGLVPLLFLLFPSGRFTSAAWRAAGWFAILAGLAFVTVTMFSPVLNNLPPVDFRFDNPVGVAAFHGGTDGPLGTLVALLGNGSFLLAGASLVVRLRASHGIVHQQLRWVVLVVALNVAVNVALIVVHVLAPALVGYWVYVLVTVLGFGVAFPVAVSVAILRYRLYDIDLIIRRTLTYAVVTALLAATYVGAVLALQELLRAVSGERSDLAVVVSTLVIAALFAPLRRRVQRFVDRRFYRARFDAEQALRSVATRLRHEVVPEELTRTVLGTIDAALQPEQLSMWLRPSAATHHSESFHTSGTQASASRATSA